MDVGKSMAELQIGEKASFVKTIGECDIYGFSGLTGDFNPVHVNEEYAKSTRFKKRIAHGGLVLGLMGPVMGMKLPGLGTIILDLYIRWKAPVYIGDTITAELEVVGKDEARHIVTLRCTWKNQDGSIVAEGETKAMPPEKN